LEKFIKKDSTSYLLMGKSRPERGTGGSGDLSDMRESERVTGTIVTG